MQRNSICYQTYAIEYQAMSEVIEVESFFILVEEISKIASKLNNLQLRIKLRLNENSRYDSMHHIFLIRELLNMRTTINELINDLMGSHLSDPSLVGTSFS